MAGTGQGENEKEYENAQKELEKLGKAQRAFFQKGRTRSVDFRVRALERLKREILKREEEICQALRKDLGKSSFESYMSEVGMTLSELSYVQKRVGKWSRVKRRLTPLSQFHADSFELWEPYGRVLIMAPWNYPFLLCMEPLIGAIGAGNCCVLKPSAYAPHVSAVIRKLVSACFPKAYIAVIEGGREENCALLEQRFDSIFFTGSVAVGKQVMKKAAEHLTPVTLELGGKSPVLVDRTADIPLAAKRIAFGKLLNAGQTCVAPDYVLVQKEVREQLIKELKRQFIKMLGKQPLENPDYPRIVNEKHYQRILGLLEGEKPLCGGYGCKKTRKIAPTLLADVKEDSPVMQEEIFGPVLPLITFTELREAEAFIQKREKPLALYLFTRDRKTQARVLKNLSFGGGCVNDTVIHLATSRMGFGGVGNSGMGSYHGKKSFAAFSRRKSIVKKYGCPDLPVRYHPYTRGKEAVLRAVLK